MAGSPDVEALLPGVLRDSCCFCLVILSFMVSSLRFSSWSKMAIPAPATSILVSREEEGEKGTPAHTPLRSTAQKVHTLFLNSSGPELTLIAMLSLKNSGVLLAREAKENGYC